MKKRVAILAASTLALGGATVGMVASVASAGTTNPPTTVAPVSDSTGSDQGAQVQVGDQTSVDSATSGDATSVEAESSTPADGLGGHQDPAGNVDNQSTTES